MSKPKAARQREQLGGWPKSGWPSRGWLKRRMAKLWRRLAKERPEDAPVKRPTRGYSD